MLGPLHNYSESDLLNALQRILARPTPVTSFDITEIAQIDAEFERRAFLACIPTWLEHESDMERERRIR